MAFHCFCWVWFSFFLTECRVPLCGSGPSRCCPSALLRAASSGDASPHFSPPFPFPSLVLLSTGSTGTQPHFHPWSCVTRGCRARETPAPAQAITVSNNPTVIFIPNYNPNLGALHCPGRCPSGADPSNGNSPTILIGTADILGENCERMAPLLPFFVLFKGDAQFSISG